MAKAIELFAERQLGTAANSPRTTRDKKYLLAELRTFLTKQDPSLGTDPFLHAIHTRHLTDFVASQAKRPAKARGDGSIRTGQPDMSPGTAGQANSLTSPLTLAKKIGDLRTYFAFACDELRAVTNDPSIALGRLAKAYKKRGRRQVNHYLPFDDDQLKKIFEPAALLAEMRDPDLFWAPLLGMYLGMRLGEIVTLSSTSIGYDDLIDVWYLDVMPEEAKNENSVRRLPLTQPLLECGFVEYVERIRSLGSPHLFPHRKMQTETAKKDPSKVASRRFGKYLDTLGISARTLVFHSFRHTVVTALQDGGTSLGDAMAICGHEAQTAAIKTGRLTASQARSVHLKDYTHAELARLGVQFPLKRLKAELERCVRPPLDLSTLRRAGDIVTSHVVKEGDLFKAGWPPQRLAYTQTQIAKLLIP
jgi:integrase